MMPLALGAMLLAFAQALQAQRKTARLAD